MTKSFNALKDALVYKTTVAPYKPTHVSCSYNKNFIRTVKYRTLDLDRHYDDFV